MRIGRAMMARYCASFRQVPRHITLDLGDTFDATHGGQQLRFFNGHQDGYYLQPITVFDGEGSPIAALLRPARRPTRCEVRAVLRRLVRAICGHWPRVENLIRANSRYCAPEVLDFCRAERLDYVLGLATTSTLRRQVEMLERSAAARHTTFPAAGRLCRYEEFYDAAASWSRSSLSLPAS